MVFDRAPLARVILGKRTESKRTISTRSKILRFFRSISCPKDFIVILGDSSTKTEGISRRILRHLFVLTRRLTIKLIKLIVAAFAALSRRFTARTTVNLARERTRATKTPCLHSSLPPIHRCVVRVSCVAGTNKFAPRLSELAVPK